MASSAPNIAMLRSDGPAGPGDGQGLRPAPARAKGRRRASLAVVASAIVCIGLPTLLAAAYYGLVAANQYVSEFKLAVRGPDRAGLDALSGGGGALAAGLIGDAFVVTDFIGSRQIVAEVNQLVPLGAVYNAGEADWLARLGERTTQEDMTLYWRRMVTAQFDMLTGIITVNVRSFRPQDSLNVARAIVKQADAMVFKMSERARHDSLHFAEEEVKRAEQQVQLARAALRKLRTDERILDATRSAQANADLLGRLKADLALMNADLATMLSYMSDKAPQIEVLRTRIRSTEEQIAKIGGSEESQADDPQTVNPQVISQFEEVTYELQFAEKAYQGALESLQRARSSADRRTTYLTLFVEPPLPEAPLYPQRLNAVLIVGLLASTFWFLGLLVIASIRDHLI